MSDGQVIGLTFLAPIFVVWLWLWLTRPRSPRYDARVPKMHRKITHNGFKSRMGAR
jgi:hypothetical protein